MMQKLYIIFKKYKITIITALVVLLIGICSLILSNSFTKNSSIKKVSDDTYAFEYDTTWKLKEKKKDSIILNHNSGSKVTIQITELADENHRDSIAGTEHHLFFYANETILAAIVSMILKIFALDGTFFDRHNVVVLILLIRFFGHQF